MYVSTKKSDAPLEGLPSSTLRHLNFPCIRDHKFSKKISKNNSGGTSPLSYAATTQSYFINAVSDGRRLQIPSWLCNVRSMYCRGLRKTNTFNIKRDSYYQILNAQLSWSSLWAASLEGERIWLTLVGGLYRIRSTTEFDWRGTSISGVSRIRRTNNQWASGKLNRSSPRSPEI
jgi:hypothetical protein